MSPEPLLAAYEIGSYLNDRGILYAVIGGLAVQVWGEPRLTVDVDLTISTSIEQELSNPVDTILERFPSRVAHALEFARKHRMILITASNGINVDISLGLPGYEDEMLARAIEFEIEPGKSIRLCSAEDLIIHKAIAGRPQDIADIQGIVYRQGDRLNLPYIRRWLNEFGAVLDDTEVQRRFENAWQKYQTG